ncbi:MAG: hypothetical protein RL112_13, partial [Planctomycetota bacterium]
MARPGRGSVQPARGARRGRRLDCPHRLATHRLSLLRHPLAWLCLLPLLLVGRRIVAGESFVAAAPAAFEPWSLEDEGRAAR